MYALMRHTVEAYQRVREQTGLDTRGHHAGKIPLRDRLCLVAISTSFNYGAPVLLQLTGFDEVKASGFQITRRQAKIWYIWAR